MEPGSDVRDRRLPEPDNVARVIDVLDATAEEFLVDALGRTVAEDNPAYPADDPVCRVVFHDDVDEIATLWSNWSPAELAEVVDARGDLTPYHFPASRLVAEARLVDVPPDELIDSPYHRREFDADDNGAYIDDVRRRGHVRSVLTVRPVDDGYELVAGHKRRWIAVEAGLETMAAEVVDLTDRAAAEAYARDHLPELSGRERRETIDALRDAGAGLELPGMRAAPDGGSR